jgi:hypothetical protein
MDDDVRNFGETLGRKVLSREWTAVHQFLAPWLRATVSVDQVSAFFEDEYRATLEANGVQALHHPEHPEPSVGGNSFMSATKLREPIAALGGKVRAVSDEVTDENMRYWLKLQLHCSEEQMAQLDFDTFCEVWIAVVMTDEGLRVGYWSHGAY